MIFEGTTPPTLSGGLPLGNTNYTFPFYVQDAAVDTYKGSTFANFTGYANRVKGISERPTE